MIGTNLPARDQNQGRHPHRTAGSSSSGAGPTLQVAATGLLRLVQAAEDSAKRVAWNDDDDLVVDAKAAKTADSDDGSVSPSLL